MDSHANKRAHARRTNRQAKAHAAVEYEASINLISSRTKGEQSARQRVIAAEATKLTLNSPALSEIV
jgi:hypothetical protein